MAYIAASAGLLEKTGWTCTSCDEHIEYVEEVFQLQVVEMRLIEGHLRYLPIMATNGDYLFDPQFICFRCWEDAYEDLKEHVDDMPSLDDMGSMFACSTCGSGIREGEYTIIATLGEMHRSRRAPQGHHDPTFVPSGAPTVLCLYCAKCVDEQSIDMWIGLGHNNDCLECAHVRCWRNDVTCECHCHTDDPYEEEDVEDDTEEDTDG
jgi:hypothetical protein